MNTAAWAILLAASVVAPARAQEVVPRERRLDLATPAGQELLVMRYAFWRHDCSAEPRPGIAVRTQPAHGTLAVRPAQSTVRTVREGSSTGCVGTVLPGTAVSYLPEPGFHGLDHFDYDILGPRSAHDMVTVTVR